MEFWQNIPLPKLVKRFDIRWPIAIKQEKLVNDVIRISLPTSRTHLRVFFISGVGGEGAQKITWKSRKKWPKIFSGNFGEMPAKSFAPLKITCSYNYVFYVCNFFLFLLLTLFCFTLNVIFFFVSENHLRLFPRKLRKMYKIFACWRDSIKQLMLTKVFFGLFKNHKTCKCLITFHTVAGGA